MGLPFPIAPPAGRRGRHGHRSDRGSACPARPRAPLMVATLALAVFAEAFWFRNPTFNGGIDGAPITNPTLFGLDLGIGAGDGYPASRSASCASWSSP